MSGFSYGYVECLYNAAEYEVCDSAEVKVGSIGLLITNTNTVATSSWTITGSPFETITTQCSIPDQTLSYSNGNWGAAAFSDCSDAEMLAATNQAVASQLALRLHLPSKALRRRQPFISRKLLTGSTPKHTPPASRT